MIWRIFFFGESESKSFVLHRVVIRREIHCFYAYFSSNQLKVKFLNKLVNFTKLFPITNCRTFVLTWAPDLLNRSSYILPDQSFVVKYPKKINTLSISFQFYLVKSVLTISIKLSDGIWQSHMSRVVSVMRMLLRIFNPWEKYYQRYYVAVDSPQ